MALAAGGCFRPVNRWSFNKPPDALANEVPRSADETQPVLVIGTFADPPATTVPMADIGLSFTKAMQQALLNEGVIDVWHNTDLAQNVDDVLRGPAYERKQRLQELHARYEHVRFVMNGIVTDFTHTRDVPKEVRRWGALGGLFGGRKEAIVAIRFTLVDLKTGRLLLSDHIFGWHQAGRKPANELYADLAFGTYLYWNSPLGRASEDVINDMLVKVEDIVPTGEERITIIKRIGPRQVRLSRAPIGVLPTNETFVVVRYDEHRRRVEYVRDRDTGQPVEARIRSGSSDKPTAWLIGLPPEGDLSGAELRPKPDPVAMAGRS